MEDNKEHSKEPWLAVTLSFLLMGAGQIYSERILRGCVLLTMDFLLPSLGLWSLLNAEHDILAVVCIGLGHAAVRIWNLFDAYQCARKVNSEQFETERKQVKDAWLAFFLSHLMSGLGQIYARRWVCGLLFVAVSLLAFILKSDYPLLGNGVLVVLGAVVSYHAYVAARTRREQSNGAVLLICGLVLCSCALGRGITYAVQTYVVEAFKIPPSLEETLGMPGGGAMKPTLIAGDKLLVRKSKKYVPSRGDIVTFRSPDDPGIPWIMRVAALPGETVEIADGVLLIDGQKVAYRTIHRIKITAETYGVERPYRVPANHIFVLGDNSADSRDSRFVGPVPLDDLIGRAYKIYWPPGRRGRLE